LRVQRASFKKVGRPREDRTARRLEIFLAVAPLLASVGHRLTMEQAARAAHVSVGTLYTYFDSKQSLLQYGLNPEPATLLCERFMLEFGGLEHSDPARYRRQLLAFLIETLSVMRASVDTTIRVGPAVARERAQDVMRQPIPQFVTLVRRGLPVSRRGRSAVYEQLVRRVMVAALLEPEFDATALHEQLQAIFTDAEFDG
jgi:AcrR family transcriptional regulator